jgi:hypothetical protein
VLLRVCGPWVVGGGARVVDGGAWAVIGGARAVSVGAGRLLWVWVFSGGAG